MFRLNNKTIITAFILVIAALVLIPVLRSSFPRLFSGFSDMAAEDEKRVRKEGVEGFQVVKQWWFSIVIVAVLLVVMFVGYYGYNSYMINKLQANSAARAAGTLGKNLRY